MVKSLSCPSCMSVRISNGQKKSTDSTRIAIESPTYLEQTRGRCGRCTAVGIKTCPDCRRLLINNVSVNRPAYECFQRLTIQVSNLESAIKERKKLVTRKRTATQGRRDRRTFWLCDSSGSFCRAWFAAARKISFRFCGLSPGILNVTQQIFN
jgi:hypothetical protein